MTTAVFTDSDSMQITPIGHIHTDFPDKFGIPRQSGLVSSLQAIITFEKDFQNPDCFRDITVFTHLWLIWGFSKNRGKGWTPTVRPPRLGGNKHTGVFASRSPFRPNALGLSSVRLEKLEITASGEPILLISGADLMDGTPIYDIKPYLPYTDSHPQACGSFSEQALSHRLQVHCEECLLNRIDADKQESMLETLSLDPRPAYQTDSERIYGMEFAGHNIRFSVTGKDLYVRDITSIASNGHQNS